MSFGSEPRCTFAILLCKLSADADIHHLVPRAAGGLDDPANLITLCDGCHAARHPNLQASLARRVIERWSLRLAHWLDRRGDIKSLDESLGPALRLLKVERFRSPQLEVVLAALRGESILLVSATSSGKSLCFQIPILLSRGTGFVISPLKALMSQQVEGLLSRQIPGTFINGDLGPQEKALRYKLLGAGVFKFLFCTPERFDPAMGRPAAPRARSASCSRSASPTRASSSPVPIGQAFHACALHGAPDALQHCSGCF